MGELRRIVLDFLFPRRCIGCEIPMTGEKESYLCPACLAGIKMKNDFVCAFCGSQVVAGLTCPFCRAGHFLDRLLVATSYENPLIEKILKTMKYRFVRTLGDDLAGLMAKYFKRRLSSGLNIDYGSTVVVSVPLHRRRLNWRGFNQAEIIGRRISSCLGLNFWENALRRNRHHAPQAGLASRESRIVNVKMAFECPKPELAFGKTVILIDDVSTTGSTLDDCARALKGAGAGAKEVIGFVFARGTPASDRKLLQ